MQRKTQPLIAIINFEGPFARCVYLNVLIKRNKKNTALEFYLPKAAYVLCLLIMLGLSVCVDVPYAPSYDK